MEASGRLRLHQMSAIRLAFVNPKQLVLTKIRGFESFARNLELELRRYALHHRCGRLGLQDLPQT